MGEKSPFNFINLKDFGRQLDTFLRHNSEETKKKLLMAGTQIEIETRQNAPVRTGNLKAGYYLNQENIGDYEVSVETNVEYAPYVELGTEKQKAQPHLEPALIKNGAEFMTNLSTSIKRSWENL